MGVIGSWIGRYRIEAMLGEGGMGAVYRADDATTGRIVALKLLRDGWARTFDVVRFKREFRAASRLRHPNCVAVYDLDQFEGRWYFTMEYLDRGCLKLARWAEPGEVVYFGMQILAALNHIHAKGIVHRDIKPPNILLSKGSNGRLLPKLADFGIARIGDFDDGWGLGVVRGTPTYLAPETLEQGVTEPRSDIFSLGLVLYGMLVGEPPGRGERNRTRRIGEESARSSITPIQELRSDVPDEVAEIVARMCATNAESRYPTAIAAFDDLSRWLRRQPGWPTHDDALEIPPLVRRMIFAPPALVGRADELSEAVALLKANLTIPKTRTPCALFVSGPPGMGKSRLVGAALRTLPPSGVTIFISSCAYEQGRAYEPLEKLLRILVEGAPRESKALRHPRASGVAAISGATANRRTAECHDDVRDSDSSGDSLASAVHHSEAVRLRFHKQLAASLIALGRQKPLVFVLEDAQWADASTLNLLSGFVRAIGDARVAGELCRVAFIITYRSTESNGPLDELVAAANSCGMAAQISLRPLSLVAAREVVASILNHELDANLEKLCEQLWRNAAGNPLFLIQILHLLEANGQLVAATAVWLTLDNISYSELPRSVVAAIGGRAARFSAQTKRTLAAASVLGRRFDLETLSVATQSEELVVLDCLDEAIQEGFVEELPESESMFQFAHDRFREALYGELSDSDRRRLHGLVAEALVSRAGGESGLAPQLAYHYGAAGADSVAYKYAMIAAEAAWERLAHGHAATLYASARSHAAAANLQVSADIVERHGDACVGTGDYDRAAACYQECLERGDNALEVLRKLADLEMRRGRPTAARMALEATLRKLDFAPPRHGILLGVRTLFHVALLVASHLLEPMVSRLKSKRRNKRLDTICATLETLSAAHAYRDIRLAASSAILALSAAARLGASATAMRTYSSGSLIMQIAGMEIIARRLSCRVESWAGRTDIPREEHVWNETFKALRALCSRPVDEALQIFERARKLADTCEEPPLTSSHRLSGELYAMALAGRFGSFPELISQMNRIAEDSNDDRARIFVNNQSAYYLTYLRNYEAAIPKWEESAARAEAVGDAVNRSFSEASLALCCALAGDRPTAAALVVSTVSEYGLRGLARFFPIDGTFLMAAGLSVSQATEARGDLARAAALIARGRRASVANLVHVTARYYGGRAIWLLATGDVRRGLDTLALALAHGKKLGLYGEMCLIHEVAARVLSADPVRQREHYEQAAALRAASNLRTDPESGSPMMPV